MVVKQWSVRSGGGSFGVSWRVLMFSYCGISIEMFWFKCFGDCWVLVSI